MDKLLTVKEACEYLNVSRYTLYRKVKEEKLKALHLGSHSIRFRKSDLDDFLNGV